MIRYRFRGEATETADQLLVDYLVERVRAAMHYHSDVKLDRIITIMDSRTLRLFNLFFEHQENPQHRVKPS